MKAAKARFPNTVQVIVNYISGQLSLEVTKSTTGKELFTLVCTCLGVKEFWYFGLQYERKQKQVAWLRPGKRIYDIVGKTGTPFYFLIKYYPEEVNKVQDDAALSFVYNQCRKEIVSGAIYCPPETSVLLASYVLQTELGDWTNVNHDGLDPASLIPKSGLSQFNANSKGWGTSLKEWHRDHEGLTPKEALTEYLRVAQYLGMYGVSYFQAKSYGIMVWIGVHPKGINIYEESLLIPRTILKWVFIKMVHYNGKKFIVRPVLETLPQYIFLFKKQHSAKQVFELAVGYHHLQIRNRLLPSISIKSESFDKETFKETTEEIHKNEVTELPGMSKHFKTRQPSYKQLPTLKEE